AASTGWKKAVQLVFERSSGLKLQNEVGQSLLSHAARNGQLDVVSYLLKEDTIESSVNQKDKSGCSPLFWAASGGHEKVVEALLLRGADWKLPNNNSRQPLSQASQNGHMSVVEKLLQ
ncbi:ankyrin repeat protein, partial [Plenodomus tracheiphilus IPT5]